MMLGLQEEFRYFECQACGTLQLLDAPDDFSRYYAGYYSLRPYREPVVRRWLKRARAEYEFFGRFNPLGWFLVYWLGLEETAFPWLHGLSLAKDAPILDVGSGSGRTLYQLQTMGFTDLTGVDPFANAASPGINIVRGEAWDVERNGFHLVMLHHSLEHAADPLRVLSAVRNVVAENGLVVVRMPVAGKHAWRCYGTDWVQLDAPRHQVLFSESGFNIAAGRAGFIIQRTVYDSTDFQFWGSEQYRQGIPQSDRLRWYGNQMNTPGRKAFSRADINTYRRKAHELNVAKDGDQACFFLRRQDVQR